MLWTTPRFASYLLWRCSAVTDVTVAHKFGIRKSSPKGHVRLVCSREIEPRFRPKPQDSHLLLGQQLRCDSWYPTCRSVPAKAIQPPSSINSHVVRREYHPQYCTIFCGNLSHNSFPSACCMVPSTNKRRRPATFSNVNTNWANIDNINSE